MLLTTGNLEDTIYFAPNSQKQEFIFYPKTPHSSDFPSHSHCLFSSGFPLLPSPPASSNSKLLCSPGIVLTFAWQNIKQQTCSIWVVSCNVILSNWQFPKGLRMEHTVPQTQGGLTVTANAGCTSNSFIFCTHESVPPLGLLFAPICRL